MDPPRNKGKGSCKDMLICNHCKCPLGGKAEKRAVITQGDLINPNI